ncbi:Peptidoglycan/LPS O-acetylase OafA/YrhL, contains acyltransferase and SGNH-hydrolase domains [Roseateles sp. YR242]|uniref:acyltransferase family protein n=1 Tax=Roseateles sp. YR242 TaxID=1855305 RepID=UPI0008B760CD|nr:acyltransferase [Roseateles sp. YR242]SEL11364.1 Peptidoglycan/LPS O-acetylase OafA/YrhL, contains acyltransferase and SGNH-hydrolase domains [Roseateles sp. YR242]
MAATPFPPSPPTPTAHSPKLASIEAARAFAALAVVFMHATHLMRVPHFSGHVGLGGLFDFGYVGVDFFFVLSGFIITFVHRSELGHGARRWPGYLWKRFVRVFPIYWLVLALTAGPSIVARALSGRTPVSELGAQDLPGTLLLWIGGEQPKYVGVAWSLQFEVLFYLSFCLLLLHLRGGLVLYGLWAVAVVAQAFDLTPGELPLQLGDPHCLQFLMGVATGLMARRAPLPLLRLQGWGVGVALVAAVLYERLGPQGPHAFGGRVALGLVSAAILATLVAMEQRRPVQVPAWLVQMGAASYSLYLAHCLLINILLTVLVKAGLYTALPEVVIFAAAVVVAVIGCGLIGRFVELPMVAWLRRRKAPRPVAVPAATA